MFLLAHLERKNNEELKQKFLSILSGNEKIKHGIYLNIIPDSYKELNDEGSKEAAWATSTMPSDCPTDVSYIMAALYSINTPS